MTAAIRKSTRSSSFASLLSSIKNTCKILLYYIVIISCITSQFLSVNALRCHQCNSHINEDCTTLRLSTPNAPRDDQFLAECVQKPGADRVFCRKTVVILEVTDQERTIRSCGWFQDPREKDNNSCFSVGNVGYKQISCVCDEDGCNGSSALHIAKWSVLSMTAASVVFVFFLNFYFLF